MNEEAITVLEERKSKICYQIVKLEERRKALQFAIDELNGKNGSIKTEVS